MSGGGKTGGERGYFMRAGDGAIVAPKTGQVTPIDKDRQRWMCVCYRCGNQKGGLSRRVAIDRHLEHIVEHPECS